MNDTCCFTGHRVISRADISDVEIRLQKTLEGLMDAGVKYFKAGGALGFDTMCANAVLKLKQTHCDVRLNLILPCPGQEKYWTKRQQDEYIKILNLADSAEYASPYYFEGCMHARNRKLVDESGYCVAYLRKSLGGAYYTVNYAKKQGLTVIEL